MKDYELFLGRFQPFHNGHKNIIDRMNNPIIVLVKGAKTKTDKSRNPFSEEYQLKLLDKVFPGIETSVSPNGFLPGIVGHLRKNGINITKVYAGEDRINSYKQVIEIANSKMPKEDEYKISFITTERLTSGTAVREVIKQGNFDLFKQLVPEELWGEWDEMSNQLRSNVC